MPFRRHADVEFQEKTIQRKEVAKNSYDLDMSEKIC
jgi:hypothetical protein